eukprot:6458868-Karenia_brevis.AAC.1
MQNSKPTNAGTKACMTDVCIPMCAGQSSPILYQWMYVSSESDTQQQHARFRSMSSSARKYKVIQSIKYVPGWCRVQRVANEYMNTCASVKKCCIYLHTYR